MGIEEFCFSPAKLFGDDADIHIIDFDSYFLKGFAGCAINFLKNNFRFADLHFIALAA